MAKRGTFYRCHLCCFGGGPQTEGVDAVWTQKLEPVGERELRSGEPVELFVTLVRCPVPLTIETAIRFDILEKDVVSDDKVGSLCCGPARQDDPDFPLLGYRKNRSLTLAEGETVEESVARFIAAFPTDYQDHLLILRDYASYETYCLVCWWNVIHTQESGDAELYFIINVTDKFETTADPVAKVLKETTATGKTSAEAGTLDANLLRTLLGARPDVTAPVYLRFAVAVSDANNVLSEDQPLPDGVPPAANDQAFRAAVALYSEKHPQPLFPPGITTPGVSPGDDASDALAGVIRPPALPPRKTSPPPVNPAPAPTSGDDAFDTEASSPSWPYGAHPNKPIAEDKVISGPSPFDGQTIALLEPDQTIEVRHETRQYVEAYNFLRAVQYGQSLFGPGGYVIFEGPVFDAGKAPPGAPAVRYTVAPLEKRFRKEDVTLKPLPDPNESGWTVNNTKFVSPYHLENRPNPDNTWNTHLWRLFANPDFSEKTPSAIAGVIPRQEGIQRTEFEYQRDALEVLQIQQFLSGEDAKDQQKAFEAAFHAIAFKDIDAAIGANETEKAVLLMSGLSHEAFETLEAATRKKYALTIFSELGRFFRNDEANHALFQLFQSFPAGEAGRTEIEAVRNDLTPAQVKRFSRTVYEELTDILIEVGKRYPESEREQVNAGYIFSIFLEAAGLQDAKSIALFLVKTLLVGVGFSGPDTLDEIAQAARSLIDFLKDFIGGIAQIVFHPIQFLQSIGSLILLLLRAILAITPLPTGFSANEIARWILSLIRASGSAPNMSLFHPLEEEDIARLIRDNAPDNVRAWMENPDPVSKEVLQILLKEQPGAVQEMDALCKKVKDSFENGILGIRKFRVGEGVLRRYRYRMVWEIASFFVGAGEIKAVLQGLRTGAEAAALLASRVAGGTEAVTALTKAAAIIEHSAPLSKTAHTIEAAAHLPAPDLDKAEKLATAANKLGEAKTIEQLAAHNPAEAVEALQDLAVETKAIDVFRTKLGGTISEAAESALARMRSQAQLTESELLTLMERLPESNADTFSRAINRLPPPETMNLAPDAMRALYRELAGNPRLAELVSRGGDFPELFAGLMKATQQRYARVEELLLAFEEQAGHLPQADLAALTNNVKAGNITALEKALAETQAAQKVAGKIAALPAVARAEAETAIAFLRENGRFTDAELVPLLEAVSEERTLQFLQAVNNLPPLDNLAWLQDSIMIRRFLSQLSRAPRSIARLAEGANEALLFERLFNAAGGGMADTEKLLAALERETLRLTEAGDAAGAARLSAEALAGRTENLDRVAETLQPLVARPADPAGQAAAAKKVADALAEAATTPPLPTARWHLRDIFGGSEGLYQSLTEAQRQALEILAGRNENLLRDMFTELDDARYAALRATLAKDLAGTKKMQAITQDALAAVDRARAARVTEVTRAIEATTGAVIREKLTMDVFRQAVASREASLQRRIADFERKAAAATDKTAKATASGQARALRNEIQKMQTWASDAAAREAELAQLHQAVEANLPLRDILHHSGDSLLMEMAVEMSFGETLKTAKELAESPLKTIANDFAQYLATRTSHFRGNFGEWELAFGLSKKGHIILKCGDEFVSRTGTDLVTMLRDNGRWRMLIFDNKALREAVVNDVSALMSNLVKNMKSDALSFAAIAKRADAPLEFAEAAQRLEKATADIEKILLKYNGSLTEAAQAEIAQALAARDIQLIVANAGGQVKGVSGPLKTMMDFYDAQRGAPFPPARPIPP